MKLTQQKINQQEVLEAINRVTGTEDGQILMAYLCHICGFFSNLMSMDDPNKTQALAAKRGVYGAMRQSVHPHNLLKIEYGIELVKTQPKKVKKDDRRSDSNS